MNLPPTDGATVLARWQHKGKNKSPRTVSSSDANITNLQKDANTKLSHEAERKRRERALDEAIENTFPASDPISAEQTGYRANVP